MSSSAGSPSSSSSSSSSGTEFVEYRYRTHFRSHDPEFDCLKSLYEKQGEQVDEERLKEEE